MTFVSSRLAYFFQAPSARLATYARELQQVPFPLRGLPCGKDGAAWTHSKSCKGLELRFWDRVWGLGFVVSPWSLKDCGDFFLDS